MCIRDSDTALDRDIVKHAAAGEFREVLECIGFGGSPDTSCLLYTSDAADERSSVDLGGRRIIKKKKKIDNERETVRDTKSREYHE